MSGEEIIRLVSAIVSCVVPLIIAFVTAVMKVVNEKRWNNLKSTLCDFIIRAENMAELKNEEKKNAVLSWCKDFCEKEKIFYNEILISEAIENLIEFTKKVNYKGK